MLDLGSGGDIAVEVACEYGSDDARAFLAAEGFRDGSIAREVDGKLVSAFVHAVKPAACCATGCCLRY